MGSSPNSSKSGASSSGLLSDVFGFFSREIESFVVNAAGGTIQQSPRPGPSRSSHKPQRVKKKSRRVNDTVLASPPDPKRGKGPKKDERGRRPTMNGRSHRSDEPDIPRTQNEPEFLKPPPPAHREKGSPKPSPATMPGSLFPRSSSTFPDFAPVLRTPRIQRISDNASPPTLEQSVDTGTEVHPTLEDHHAEADISSEEDSPSPPRPSAKAKGKQRAVEPPFGRDPGETTTEYEVRGKEWELVNVLESHRTAEKRLDDGTAVEDREQIELERDWDKERIRILEQEVAQLRRELERRKTSDSYRQSSAQPAHTVMPPPPPPPPPPPLGLNSYIPAVRLPGSGSKSTEEFLSSARAALKHTTLPVEAPINSIYAPSRTKRTGQPTVNLGGDKMAAFLSEMKSVKLRKTGSLASIHSTGTQVNPLGRETNAAALKRRLSAGGVETGNKRQKTANNPAPSVVSKLKRRLTTSNTSFDFSSIPREVPPSPPDSRPPTSAPLPPATIHPAMKPNSLTRGSGSTDDTPSLCSDHEPSQENSTEDRLPITPPHARRSKSKGSQNPNQQLAKEAIVIDESPPALTRFANMRATERQRSTDVSEMPPPLAVLSVTRPSSPPVRPPTPTLIFPKRIPSSPMPRMRTPKRPRRPAKSRVVPVEPVRTVAHFSDDELEYASENDNHTLSFFNEKSFAGVTPYPKAVATGAFPNGHARQKTLDEEIRIAENDGLFDSDILVGVGTSRKRGFLKGGGAAGTPVHMGVGYVIGAEESEDEEPPDHQTVRGAGDDLDDEDERLLARPPSAIPVRKGQIAKRSWLPVAIPATSSAARLQGKGRGRR